VDDGVIKIGMMIDTSSLGVAKGQAEESSESIATSYRNIGTAAGGAAEKITAAGAASTQSVSEHRAAAAAMREFEGNFTRNTRAADQFLISTLKIGPALQAAFPVVGAIALGGIFVSVGEKIYEAFDMGGERARKFNEDVMELTVSGAKWTTAMDVQIDRLNMETAKLEHKPENNLKKSLDEAAESAQRLGDHLTEDIKKELQLITEVSGTTAQRLLGQTPNTDVEARIERAYQKQIQRIQAYGEGTNQPKHMLSSMEDEKAALKKRQTDIYTGANSTNRDAESALIDQMIEEVNVRENAIRKTMELTDAEKAHNAAVAAHTGKENYEEDLSAQELYHGKSLGFEVMYWDNIVRTTGQHHEQLLRAEEEFQKQIVEPGKIKKEQEKENAKGGAPDAFIRIPEEKITEAEANERINRELDRQLKTTKEIYEETVKTIQFKEKIGQLGPRQAATAERAASDAEYKSTIAPLQAQQYAMAPMGKGVLDTKQLAEYNRLQEMIDDAARKHANQRSQIDQKEIESRVEAWKKAENQINSAFIGGLNQWMTTHKSFANSMIEASKKMAVSMIDDLVRISLKHLETQMMMTTHNAAGNATRTAQNKSSDAVSQLSGAKVAAVKAFNAMAGIPFVGPVLGAAAAAAAFALCMAFEKGGVVPGRSGDGVPILAHAGEAVLPQPMTSMLMNVANTGGGTGGHTFRSSSTINATVLDSKGLAGFARRAADMNIAQMRYGARRLNATM